MNPDHPAPISPATRPRCLFCDKPLRQRVKSVYRRIETPNLVGGIDAHTEVEQQPTGLYGVAGEGFFCTLTCGFDWAVQLARQGHR
jgi:hypothetical protein